MTDLKIDPSEAFEHLPSAPIVEAVIHWRARCGKKLVPDDFLGELTSRLPDYPTSQRQQHLDVGAEFSAEGSSIRQHHDWHGFRFESADKKHVAQFTRNGFIFSRLQPYNDWTEFEAEALRLWKVYCELAEPTEVERLGVRFINLIVPVNLDDLDELSAVPPRSPDAMRLPLKGFMHQNSFDIPGYPYSLNVIQTVQPPSHPQPDAFGLILDLDVFTNVPIGLDEVATRLPQMHWIKNKAFFSFLTSKAIARFRENAQ